MRNLMWLVMGVLLILAGCGSGNSDFEESDIWQKTFTPGSALSFTLDSGASASLPADTFTEEMKLLFSDRINSDDSNPDHYPTTTHEANDQLGGIVFNTPVDALFLNSIPITIAMRDYGTLKPVVLADTQYALFRFDFEENRWNRWGSLAATTNATGTLATVTLPTSGFMGYLGTIAIFEGQTVAALGAAEPTYIEGYVKNMSNNPLGTDVAVYQLVGEVMHPVDLSADNATARVPALPDPNDESLPITAACVVDSDPTTGYFRIELPWRMVGTLTRLEFGHEHAGHQLQNEWVIDFPLPTEESERGDKVRSMAMAYGRNTISPRPVMVTN
jgi:hypothetical protein